MLKSLVNTTNGLTAEQEEHIDALQDEIDEI